MKTRRKRIRIGLAWLAVFTASAAVAQRTAANSGDEAAVRKVLDEFSAAWRQNDAQAMSMFYATDADVVTLDGRTVSGRANIETMFAEDHTSWLAESRYKATVNHIQFLAADVALVDGAFEISGMRDDSNNELPAMKGFFTLVVVNKDGKWQIVADRPMLPGPLAAPHD